MIENKDTALTEKDFNEFMSATGEEQWKILLAHAERNKKIIQNKKTKAKGPDDKYVVEVTEE